MVMKFLNKLFKKNYNCGNCRYWTRNVVDDYKFTNGFCFCLSQFQLIKITINETLKPQKIIGKVRFYTEEDFYCNKHLFKKQQFNFKAIFRNV